MRSPSRLTQWRKKYQVPQLFHCFRCRSGYVPQSQTKEGSRSYQRATTPIFSGFVHVYSQLPPRCQLIYYIQISRYKLCISFVRLTRKTHRKRLFQCRETFRDMAQPDEEILILIKVIEALVFEGRMFLVLGTGEIRNIETWPLDVDRGIVPGDAAFA